MTGNAFDGLRSEIIGLDEEIPLLGGGRGRYVFLDNAASTPAFRSVLKAVEDFMPWYSGVHRGTGYKAVVATSVFDATRGVAARFVGADPASDVVIYVKNTTEAVNLLAARFGFAPDDVVVTTQMEHHSNDLPWRKQCRVVHVGIDGSGGPDMPELSAAIANHAGRLKLVAVCAASNVTGFINPVHDIAAMAHRAGASIFVDAAQIVAHRPFDVLPAGDPGHIDFTAYSAHKMYAPFGTGVLIGPRDFFNQRAPDVVGGGTVKFVGLDEVEWADSPHRDEAGSPNVPGAVALARAITILESVGMEQIAAHERELLLRAHRGLNNIKGVTLYGTDPAATDRVGVLPFTIEGYDHALVATILSLEGGIGVRNGNFCAQNYMRKLLRVTAEEEKTIRAEKCDNPALPGMARASLGCYNNEEDVDKFVRMVGKIARGEIRGKYELNLMTGRYEAEGHETSLPPGFEYLNGRG